VGWLGLVRGSGADQDSVQCSYSQEKTTSSEVVYVIWQDAVWRDTGRRPVQGTGHRRMERMDSLMSWSLDGLRSQSGQ